MNAQGATIGEMQRKNMLLSNVFKRASKEQGNDMQTYLRVQLYFEAQKKELGEA